MIVMTGSSSASWNQAISCLIGEAPGCSPSPHGTGWPAWAAWIEAAAERAIAAARDIQRMGSIRVVITHGEREIARASRGPLAPFCAESRESWHESLP